jgi:hypothetical protein
VAPKTDYTENPSPSLAGTVYIRGKRYETKEVLDPWLERKDKAAKHREQFLPQVRINRKFAAGKQHLNVNTRTGRVIDVRERNGIRLVTSDILSQYLMTVIGRMAANDYRPNFLALQGNEMAEQITQHMNDTFGWGWDNEWLAERVMLGVFRLLVTDGTCAVRCRYDRTIGTLLADEVPYKDGVPLVDEQERNAYMDEMVSKGEQAEFGPLREGKVKWELFSFENLLTPPGVEDDANFPWDLIQRPVPVKEVKDRYKIDVSAQNIESSASLTTGLGFGDEEQTKLEDQCFVYTGYERPNKKHPVGQTVIFTEDALLDVFDNLPYPDHPRGPRTGLHYFRWQAVPGRFPGKGFIENGIGPQQVRNKRLTQIDAIIDRNMPKVYIEEQSLARPQTGEPMEYVEVRPGSPLPQTETGVAPGQWMLQDIKLQDENAERALGMGRTSLGQAPSGVSAYSAMALLTENDALKLDPIAQAIRLEMVELSWDTMEAMRNWPTDKKMLIAGPENQLRAVMWNENQIPVDYLVKQPRGGSIPRSQAAELQKVNDIWTASKGQLPLSWYKQSLDAGHAQDFPPSVADADAHKAELENIVMSNTLESVPVAPYDNHEKHAEIHRAYQIPLRALADQGDESAQQQVAVLDQHIEEHLMTAQKNVAEQPAPEMATMNPPMDSPQAAMPPNLPPVPPIG